MATHSHFYELTIWQESRAAFKAVILLVNACRAAKDHRFRDQLSAAAGSAADNIAEGFERGGTNEFIDFLPIAKGSTGKVRSQLYRGIGLGHCEESAAMLEVKRYDQLAANLSGCMSYLCKSGRRGIKFKDLQG
ncbi:MAG: four helix bundle protein [Chitinophagaceae bacterium]|jgi:four helix bundle protein|nr:four helix bundle protein [Chitinophagaceae bacterium]